MGFPSACGIPGEQLATQCSASRIIQRGWKRYRRNAEIERRISTHGSSRVAATVEPFGEQLNYFFAELPEPNSTAAGAPASCPDYLLSCVGSWEPLPQISRDTGLGEELRVEDWPENASVAISTATSAPSVAWPKLRTNFPTTSIKRTHIVIVLGDSCSRHNAPHWNGYCAVPRSLAAW